MLARWVLVSDLAFGLGPCRSAMGSGGYNMGSGGFSWVLSLLNTLLATAVFIHTDHLSHR
jgi:hypothetical protein